jgi:hypothetical protein
MSLIPRGPVSSAEKLTSKGFICTSVSLNEKSCGCHQETSRSYARNCAASQIETTIGPKTVINRINLFGRRPASCVFMVPFSAESYSLMPV